MEKEEVIALLHRVPLFEGVTEETMAHAATLCIVRYCKVGESLGEGELGVVAEGIMRVSTAVPGHAVMLRGIQPCEIFGAASLFGQGVPDTRVTAQKDSTVLCFSRAAVETLLRESGTLVLSYIAFLSDRVAFLNRKIAAFSAGSTAATLEQYLLGLPAENGLISLPPLQRLAAQLGMGRASLYRAFEELETRGLIERVAPRTVRYLTKNR